MAYYPSSGGGGSYYTGNTGGYNNHHTHTQDFLMEEDPELTWEERKRIPSLARRVVNRLYEADPQSAVSFAARPSGNALFLLA
jgi:hypothetical protein